MRNSRRDGWMCGRMDVPLSHVAGTVGCPHNLSKFFTLCSDAVRLSPSPARSPDHLILSKTKLSRPSLITAIYEFQSYVCLETRINREHLESKLQCGIPNANTVDDEVVEERGRSTRFKRVVGGAPAKPVSWKHTCLSIFGTFI